MVSLYLRFTPEDGKGSEEVRKLLQDALRQAGLYDLPRMEKDVYGKPYFPDYPGLFFSLSHTRQCVCCAIADAPVGVDVELRRPMKYQERIVRRFSKEEQMFWTQTPETEREKLFFQLWVLKESYGKADGRGMGLPLDSYSVLPKRESLCMPDWGEKSWSIAPQQGKGADAGKKSYYLRLYKLGDLPYELAVCAQDAQLAEQVIRLG